MESEFIGWLRQRLPRSPGVRVGAGDDAAVLRMAAGLDCVVTSDLLTDEVDFRIEQCDPRRVGRKALAVNLSDLASMAARPLAAIVSLALPRDSAYELATALYEGMLPLANEFKCPIAGGDTNCWPGRLVVSVTAIGTAPHGAWLRSGALPGDQILVTGSFGGSLLGRHFDFRPRVFEALQLAAQYEIHACVDVSDGLSLDLSRLATESGRGAEVILDQVPISDAARRMAEQDGRTPLDHALSDGEDFELILAAPPQEAQRLLQQQPLDVPIRAIGRFVASPGLWRTTADGGRQPLQPAGFQHGSNSR